jgi:hypothetical protein
MSVLLRSCLGFKDLATYANAVCERAVHVAQEHVTKFDGVKPGRENTPLRWSVTRKHELLRVLTYIRIEHPFSHAMVEDGRRKEYEQDTNESEYERIV